MTICCMQSHRSFPFEYPGIGAPRTLRSSFAAFVAERCCMPQRLRRRRDSGSCCSPRPVLSVLRRREKGGVEGRLVRGTTFCGWWLEVGVPSPCYIAEFVFRNEGHANSRKAGRLVPLAKSEFEVAKFGRAQAEFGRHIASKAVEVGPSLADVDRVRGPRSFGRFRPRVRAEFDQ